MMAALSRAEKLGKGRPEDVKHPVLCLLEYNDGFRASVLMLGGLVSEYLVATRVKGRQEIDSTSCYVPAENSNNFSMLVHGIAQMYQTGKPSHPVERTLLTTGALSYLDGIGISGTQTAGDTDAERELQGSERILLRAWKGLIMAVEKLVGATPKIEKIATGFSFTEGPVFSRIGYLLFSDIPKNRIMKWQPGSEATVFRENSNGANGLTFDHQGRLLTCEQNRVTRTEKDGKITELAANHRR